MNRLPVAASRQSAAGWLLSRTAALCRDPATPVHGEPSFVFRMHWDHEPPPHPPFGHPLPLGGGEGGVRGVHGERDRVRRFASATAKTRLSQNLLHHIPIDIREPEI